MWAEGLSLRETAELVTRLRLCLSATNLTTLGQECDQSGDAAAQPHYRHRGLIVSQGDQTGVRLARVRTTGQ